MRPVRAFDASTNEEVNLEIGREYALRALARHLSEDDDVQFSSGGERLIEAGIKADRYRIVCEWPRERRQAHRAARQDRCRPWDRPHREAGVPREAVHGQAGPFEHGGGLGTLHQRALTAALDQVLRAKPEERRHALNKAVAALEERGLAEAGAAAKSDSRRREPHRHHGDARNSSMR